MPTKGFSTGSLPPQLKLGLKKAFCCSQYNRLCCQLEFSMCVCLVPFANVSPDPKRLVTPVLRYCYRMSFCGCSLVSASMNIIFNGKWSHADGTPEWDFHASCILFSSLSAFDLSHLPSTTFLLQPNLVNKVLVEGVALVYGPFFLSAVITVRISMTALTVLG